MILLITLITPLLSGQPKYLELAYGNLLLIFTANLTSIER